MPDVASSPGAAAPSSRGSAVDRLIRCPEAFDLSERNNALFLAAMRENFRHHFSACEPYRKLCIREGFSPEDLRRYEDIPRIPHIFVTVFKRRQLLSAPLESIALTLTSSGTGGEKSAIYLDAISLRRIRSIVHHIYRAFSMVDREHATNYLCFTYDPRVAKDLGTAFSDKLLTGLTKVGKVFYALRYDRKAADFVLDREGCFKALERFACEGKPFRILGFPSFTWEVLAEYVSRSGRGFSFGPSSYVIMGGGWKTLADKEIPKDLFRRQVGEWLGIPPSNVRDLLGMVEHGVPYCECEFGNMHVPLYSRVYVRDPGTLAILPYGETGIFHLVTPYLNSFPALSLLTTDIGRLVQSCPCGRNSPYLQIIGRGGVKKHQGCALAALKFLQ